MGDFDKYTGNIPASRSGGDQVVGDKITLGDTTGSAVAVGRGAQAIIQNIQTYVERSLTDFELVEQAEIQEERHLAESVTSYIQRLKRRAESPTYLPGKGNPYKSLLEYDLQDAGIFYGRSIALEELLEHVMQDQLTVLHSRSGVGKTSLLKAGLMPRLLIEGHIPLYLRPYSTPVPLALKRTLIANLDMVPRIAESPLYDLLRGVSGLLGGKQMIVIVDQFEELFTVQSETERQLFIQELKPCLEDSSLFVRWIFAIRAEWFSQLGTLRPQIRNPFENELQLNALNRAEAQEVILEPAKRQNIIYETELVQRLLDDLGEDEISPPELQLVCSALFDDLNGESKITEKMYLSAGETRGILRGHLNRVLQRDISPNLRRPARSLFIALVTSNGRRGMRNHDELYAELKHLNVSQSDFNALLDQLVTSRLLRVDEQGEDLGGHTYELTHDYLLDEIELDPEIKSRKAAQELLNQEVEVYHQHQTLLPWDKLLIIEAHESALVLDTDAQALLDESREAILAAERAAEADRQRIRRAALIGSLSGAVIFPVMFYFYLIRFAEVRNLLDTFVLLSILPGAVAGLLLIVLVDMALSATKDSPSWQRFLGVAVAGAISFGFLMSYLGILDSSSGEYAAIVLATMVGGIWGIGAGLGRAWVASQVRQHWQTIPVVAVACGLLFLVAGLIASQMGIVQDSSILFLGFAADNIYSISGYVFLAGALIPAVILLGASLAD